MLPAKFHVVLCFKNIDFDVIEKVPVALPENEFDPKTKIRAWKQKYVRACFAIAMLLYKGLTHIHS